MTNHYDSEERQALRFCACVCNCSNSLSAGYEPDEKLCDFCFEEHGVAVMDTDPTPPHGTPRPSAELLSVLLSLRGIEDYAHQCYEYLKRGRNPRYIADTVKGLGILVAELSDRVDLLSAPADTPSAFGGALER